MRTPFRASSSLLVTVFSTPPALRLPWQGKRIRPLRRTVGRLSCAVPNPVLSLPITIGVCVTAGALRMMGAAHATFRTEPTQAANSPQPEHEPKSSQAGPHNRHSPYDANGTSRVRAPPCRLRQNSDRNRARFTPQERPFMGSKKPSDSPGAPCQVGPVCPARHPVGRFLPRQRRQVPVGSGLPPSKRRMLPVDPQGAWVRGAARNFQSRPL